MALNVTVWEDSGPITSNRGTTRIQVTNIGWKSTGTDETNLYVYNPIIRPQDNIPLTYSYKKYNYMKIAGTYPVGCRPRIKIRGDYNGDPPQGYEGTDKVRLYYKLSTVYEEPNNTWDGSLIYIPPGATRILYPMVSTSGPESASSYSQYLTANTTYYSQYLVTQLVVEQGAEVDFGNIGELNIEWYMDEYEGTNV